MDAITPVTPRYGAVVVTPLPLGLRRLLGAGRAADAKSVMLRYAAATADSAALLRAVSHCRARCCERLH